MTRVSDIGIKLEQDDPSIGRLISISVEKLLEREIKEGVKEVNVITIKPLQKRGQHYHDTKEWFFIIKGHGVIVHHPNGSRNTVLRRICECKKGNPSLIEIQPNDCHILKNTCPDTMLYLLSLLPEKFERIKTARCTMDVHGEVDER